MRKLVITGVLIILCLLVKAQGNFEYLKFTDDNTVYINSIKWEFSSSKLHSISFNTLDSLSLYLKQVPDIKVDFVLYEQFKDEHSQSFINNRVLSIIDYLHSKGIEKGRIVGNSKYLSEENEYATSFILMKFYTE